MRIVTGVDLVYLPSFKRSAKFGGESFLRRVYLESELNNKSPQHLAGIFAAKEAVMKALSLLPGSWHSIQITYQPSGAPKVLLPSYQLPSTHYSLSISHDGQYVIALFTAILKDDAAT